METQQKEETSTVNSSCNTDCNMENSNEKLVQKEHTSADAPDLMVNSSKTPLFENSSNNINSDVHYTVSDEYLVVENQDDELSKHEKHHLLEDDIKNSENDSESCESLVQENKSAVIEVLSPITAENSKHITLYEGDSIELINQTNNFSNLNNSNNVLNESSNICDATLDSTTNQNNGSSIYEETGNASVNSESLVENKSFKCDFVTEENIIEEVVMSIVGINDNSELFSDDPGADICVNDKDNHQSDNHDEDSLPSTESPEETTSKSSRKEIIIEETIVDNSNVPSNCFQTDDNQANMNELGHHCKEDMKIILSSTDNCALVEKEILVPEESKKISSNLPNSLPEDVSEKHEDFSGNVKLALLKSVEDKITVFEETTNLTDVFNSSEIDSHLENNQVSVPCSDITSEKEILSPENNSAEENQTSSCQISEDNLNTSCVTSESYEAKSDYCIVNNNETSYTSPEKEIQEEEFLDSESNFNDENQELSSTMMSKKCPKIKISFKKPYGDSPDSLKNWFVSESSETELKSSVSSKALVKTDDIIMNSNETLNSSPNLNADISLINSSKSYKSNSDESHFGDIQTPPKYDVLLPCSDISSVVLLEKTNNELLCNSKVDSSDKINSLADAELPIKTGKTLPEDQSIEKMDCSSSKEISLPDNKVRFDKNIKCASENQISCDHKEVPKSLLAEKKQYDHDVYPVFIKEEPIDIEENNESEMKANNPILEEGTIKIEPTENKRKRGRPCKSMNYCDGLSLDFGGSKAVSKRRRTISATPVEKKKEVKPKRDAKTTPVARSADQPVMDKSFDRAFLKEHNYSKKFSESAVCEHQARFRIERSKFSLVTVISKFNLSLLVDPSCVGRKNLCPLLGSGAHWTKRK